MTKGAIIVLAGTESHADRGRVFNALEAAREFKENNDEFKLIFDGAGTGWIPKLEDEDNDFHELYKSLHDNVAACDFCSGAFGVSDEVDDANVVRLDQHDGHPSLRSLVEEGYEVITF